MSVKLYQLSSLAKVFEDKIYGDSIDKLLLVKGQSSAYQIAFLGDGEYTFKVSSEVLDYIKIYKVGYVPSNLPVYPHSNDENYLVYEPCNLPDPLFPAEDNKITLENGKYLTLWLDINVPNDAKIGTFPVEFTLYKDGNEDEKSEIALEIKDITLPDPDIIFTQWFHTDCIADVHGVEVFSPEHWELIDKYIALAAEGGINMILVPVVTPPLDTEVGGERTTVQLARIEKTDKGYNIDLSRLERFIDICLKNGIKYFEINHFFTQWGAKNAPKVIATVDGEEKKIFGWETPATSPEYCEFLGAIVPKIIDTFEKKGIEKPRLYFHVSDEPSGEQLDSYRAAADIILPLVKGCNHTDALSHFDFYEQGLVPNPVVATDALEPFIEAKAKGIWCYYCCAQTKEVANRLMSMPSARSRIIGTQIYKYDMAGFLHWGYNFYNTQYSKKKINPYEITDAGGAFPSGDAFSVYPYKNGVIPSLRLRVFKEALCDIALLKLLEAKIGKDATVALIDRVAGENITFRKYPKEESFFSRLYYEIISELEK